MERPAERRSGERRHLTVLFCDLVGSTALAAQLDPEEWREIVGSYHRVAAEAIERFGGYIAQYLGDGVMAYFGWPEAHENDAERGVRAGLAILNSLANLSSQPKYPQLSGRVGIDSGQVVVGEGSRGAHVFGEAPNIAARVQAAAAPDTVTITREVRELIRGLFIDEHRGLHQLKGIAAPIELFTVIRPSGARGRLGAANNKLTRFVGREQDIRVLLSQWEHARAGKGQVLIVVGEPGIGKSRLIREFHEQIAGEPHLWIESAADQLAQSRPFYAVTEILRQGLGWRGDESAEWRIGSLAMSLRKAGQNVRQALPLMAPLLDLPVPKTYPPLLAALQEQRRRLFLSLSRWVRGTSETQPSIIVLEDLHWADPSTIELAKLLVDQCTTVPLMLIYTVRPEAWVPWPMQSNYAQLTINRLAESEVRQLVDAVAQQGRLSRTTVEAVVERASGVPLFVEELTRDLIERGEHSLENQIPATLRDSLMARLDRLGSAREVAQIGAAIGREFSYKLLQHVVPAGEDSTQIALDRLVKADLIYAHTNVDGMKYIFRHALVQDAAYNTLLKSRRRELHHRIVEVLEQSFPEIVSAEPSLIAHHYTEAGLIPQAVRYWRKAGRKALERSATTEAISQLKKGLELIKTLAPSQERVSEEIKIHMTLMAPLIATLGYTSSEVEKNCNRALELCEQLGQTRQLFTALGNLSSVYYNRGELEIALELGKRMLRLAQSSRDQILLLWGHYALGFTLASQGMLVQARRHLEQSLALYDSRKGQEYRFVQDPGPTALANLSHVYHFLGYGDRALESMKQALALARRLSHPFTLAWVLGSAGILLWVRGEKAEAQGLWRERIALCDQQGFTPLLAEAEMWIGFAIVDSGMVEDGVIKIRDAMKSFAESSTFSERLRGLTLLAFAEGKAGRVDQGLAKLEEVLTSDQKGKGSWFSSELYLIKGLLLLMNSRLRFS